MRCIRSTYYYLLSLFLVYMPVANAAGLQKTKSTIEEFQVWIHSVVGIVFAITGVVVGAMLWRGRTPWEDVSKWVYGVIFAGAAVEFIALFYAA